MFGKLKSVINYILIFDNFFVDKNDDKIFKFLFLKFLI